MLSRLKTDDGYSFQKLLDVLKEKEDHSDYNIVTYTDWWIFNCFQPLYSIGESEVESFLVYEMYLHNIARNAVLLSEKKEDMSNRQFFDAIIRFSRMNKSRRWRRKSMVEIKGLNEYQQRALETAIYPEDKKIIYPTLGLTGEAGEVADKVKKVLRDNNQVFDDEHRKAIALELSDVMWYCATLANDLGYTLQEIAEMNYEKLSSRQKRGKINGNGDYR